MRNYDAPTIALLRRALDEIIVDPRFLSRKSAIALEIAELYAIWHVRRTPLSKNFATRREGKAAHYNVTSRSAPFSPRRRIFSQRVVRPIPSSFDAAPTSPLVAVRALRI